MGQTASNVAKKIVSPITGSFSSSNSVKVEENLTACRQITPFVYTRRGSMYFDEDGDLAHEFYEEIPIDRNGKRRKMCQHERNLTAQGDVLLPFPKLHVDFPVVLCDTTALTSFGHRATD